MRRGQPGKVSHETGLAAAPFSLVRRLLLVADDLDEPAAVARAIELDEEDPLPGAEAKLAVAHGDRLAGGAEQHGHAMRMAVAELHVLGAHVLSAPVPVVVRVVLLARNEPAEHPDEVVEEARFEFVHAHHARRVRRVHARDAVVDAALGNALSDFVGDVADLEATPRSQTALLLEDLHASSHLHRFEGLHDPQGVFVDAHAVCVQNQPALRLPGRACSSVVRAADS
jgi:hypothetical protein